MEFAFIVHDILVQPSLFLVIMQSILFAWSAYVMLFCIVFMSNSLETPVIFTVYQVCSSCVYIYEGMCGLHYYTCLLVFILGVLVTSRCDTLVICVSDSGDAFRTRDEINAGYLVGEFAIKL